MRHDDDVHRWAAPYLRRPLPLFGSPEWVAASAMTRLASAVRAALAWYEDADAHRIAARLDVELEAARRYDEADYIGWREVAGRVRHVAVEPTFAELQRRRSA